MAFSMRKLSVLAYANGFTLWHYKAEEETLAGVASSGFFADASEMLASGDLLMVSASDGARIIAVAPAGVGAELAMAPLS